MEKEGEVHEGREKESEGSLCQARLRVFAHGSLSGPCIDTNSLLNVCAVHVIVKSCINVRMNRPGLPVIRPK